MIDKNTPTAFVLSMPVDELQLDTHHNLHQRVMDCFWCAKIETIGDLVEQSERDLMKIGHIFFIPNCYIPYISLIMFMLAEVLCKSKLMMRKSKISGRI